MRNSGREETVYTLQFFKICISGMGLFFSFNLILAELPSVLSGLGGDKYLGYIIGCFTLSAAISRPFSGFLSDTWGRKPVFIIGVLVVLVASALYPLLANSVAMFLFLRFFHGFSAGFGPTATSSMVADIVPTHRRGEAIGIMGLFSSCGLAIAPSLGSYLRSTFSMDFVFYAASVVGLASFILIMTVSETRKDSVENNTRFSFDNIIDRRMFWPGLNSVLVLFPFGMVLTLMPDFSDRLGVENRGMFFTVYVLSSMVVRFNIGKLSDRVGRREVLLFSNLILTIATALFMFVTNSWELWVLGVVFGVGVGMNSPVTFAWAIDLSKGKYTGRAISTVFLFLETGIGLGAVWSGSYYKGVPENMTTCFLVSASCCCVAFLLMAFQLILSKSNIFK